AGLGEANADLLQEAAAIEQQIRKDFANLNQEGFFAIQCNAVRNDYNSPILLDPNRAPNARIRADQIIFFTTGAESTRLYNRSAFDSFANSRNQQSSTSRVYYGHAFQLPEAPASHDPIQEWWPWQIGLVTLQDRGLSGATIEFNVPLIPPENWLLSRQVVLLADDGGDRTDYFGSDNSAFDIWDEEIRYGRVDIAGSSLRDIRQYVMTGNVNNNEIQDWSLQSARIVDAFFYPRAERTPPLESGNTGNPNNNYVRREDHALTAHVLGAGCSEFRVDWTYRDGSGEFDPDYNPATIIPVKFQGVIIPSAHPQPWFGHDDLEGVVGSYQNLREDPADYGRFPDVMRYSNWDNVAFGSDSILPAAIERPVFAGGGTPNFQYRAFFGYNRVEPRDKFDSNNNGNIQEFIIDMPANEQVDAGYTPWPDAVRITMTLHDKEGRLENGRTFQFVIQLPSQDP
ncbi:MAG: hypothetical protein O7G85_00110, partial [Planctomycetota bacterium]|nr:hypothetical protein [Planctomycetota bacterium]